LGRMKRTLTAPAEAHAALAELLALAGVEARLTDGPLPQAPVRAGALLDHLAAQTSPVRIAGRAVDWNALTEREGALLRALADAAPGAVAADVLLARVWGWRADLETHTLATHIHRLRRKLGPGAVVTTPDGYTLGA